MAAPGKGNPHREQTGSVMNFTFARQSLQINPCAGVALPWSHT
jgi:hypothetical protein